MSARSGFFEGLSTSTAARTMTQHPFDAARQDLWQRQEAVRLAEQLGGVRIDPSRRAAGFAPAGFLEGPSTSTAMYTARGVYGSGNPARSPDPSQRRSS